MRVYGGSFKKKRIFTGSSKKQKVTLSRIRNYIYSTLSNFLFLEDKKDVFIDPFVGTGSLFIEALSRYPFTLGFANDKKRSSFLLVKKNISRCHLDERTLLLNKDYQIFFKFIKKKITSAEQKIGLLILDPPFRLISSIYWIISFCLKWELFKLGTIILIESTKTFSFLDLKLVKKKKYSKINILMLKKIISKAKVIIISGPSGVGKSTIIKNLFLNFEKKLALFYSVSYTTRKRRKNEIEGKDYYFVTKNKFESLIAKDYFFEYTNFINNYYGTPKEHLFELLNDEKNVVLEIETTGAENVINFFREKKMLQRLVLIYVLPPSLSELDLRIKKRQTESEDSIKMRIGKAGAEMQQKNIYSYHVVNNKDRINETVEEIGRILKKELNQKPVFYASILTINHFNLKNEISDLVRAGINGIHYDVIDFSFANNLTFGPGLFNSIYHHFPKLNYSCHFMVSLPEERKMFSLLEPFKKAESISFHIEKLTCPQMIDFFTFCEKNKIKKGLAIDPDTDLLLLIPFLKRIDFVLLMSVKAGFGGQKFLESTVLRIETLKKIFDKNECSQIQVIVDGGLKKDNLLPLFKKGADAFVIGSYLWKNPDNIFETTHEIVSLFDFEKEK